LLHQKCEEECSWGPDAHCQWNAPFSSVKRQERCFSSPLMHTALDIVDVMRHHSRSIEINCFEIRSEGLYCTRGLIYGWFYMRRNEFTIYANRFSLCLLAHFNYVIAPINVVSSSGIFCACANYTAHALHSSTANNYQRLVSRQREAFSL